MKKILFFIFASILSHLSIAGEMPFIKASAVPADVKSLLVKSGFQIIGEYTPYPDTQILVITHKQLQENAAKSKSGGYAASLRVAISNNKVSYNNPVYQAAVYHTKNNLSYIKDLFKQALGDEGQFGADNPRSTDDLIDYHYMAFMPYFDDQETLNTFESHQEAVNVILSNLQSNTLGATKVYRLDIPDTQQTIIGVGIQTGNGADEKIMRTLTESSAAHLPYEILIMDKKVVMLHPKFRIAISAPDLSMGDFVDIMSAPDAIIDLGKAISSTK